VVRCFEDSNIIHVDGSIDPMRDLETINMELIFSDMETLERRMDRVRKAMKGDKSLGAELALLERVMKGLEDGKCARSLDYDEEELAIVLDCQLLSMKPVIALDDGNVVMIGKARGSKQGNNLLRLLIEQCGGINFDMPFCLAYSGLSDAMLNKYIADSAELWRGKTENLPIATIGCAIGAHAGPGTIAIAFFEN
jgi:hypothetical protein